MIKQLALTTAIALAVINAFGQTSSKKINLTVSNISQAEQNDSSVTVLYTIGPSTRAQRTAYFLNDRFIRYNLLVSSNPALIDGIERVDKPLVIDGVSYERQVRLTSKNPYFPKAITLNNLKNKYYPEGIKNESILFMIDGNVIRGDYNVEEIDEANLHAITLDTEIKTDKVKVQFIKLTTKSESGINQLKSGNVWLKKDGVLLSR